MKPTALTELATMQLMGGLTFHEVSEIIVQLPPKQMAPVAKKNGFTNRIKKLLEPTQVVHATLGIGVVIEQWGAWNVCVECLEEMQVGEYSCSCGGRVIRVSGRGIFNVRFKDGVHAINRVWLKKVE